MADTTNSIKIFKRRHSIHGGPVTCATIRFPPQSSVEDTIVTSDDVSAQKYNHLKSLGRVVLSRGGWIESHPLCSSISDQDGTCSTDARVYKTLAFGNSKDVAFDTVSGMLFPSSSASLSSLNDAPESNVNNTIQSRISVLAYGGRRLSCLSGGGLWSANGYAADEFIHIPIVKSSTDTNNYDSSTVLETPDWIHDASLINLDFSTSLETNTAQTQNAFLLALGMVNNNVEIYGFRPSTLRSEQQKNRLGLEATKLQRISCDVRCMTYSLSFHGWKYQVIQSNSDLPCLVAASGTVFGEIIVWGVVNENLNENSLRREVDRWCSHESTDCISRLRASPSYCLKGHHGSVFSVKFGPRGVIASTSDDRTVRLWTLTEDILRNKEIIASDILELQSTHSYTLAWTGWGHTARVWDVSFVPCRDGESSIVLVSAGEDAVARVWSPFAADKEFRKPLRGHRCESVWTVDVCEGIAVTGGNDGSVKLFDLEGHFADDGAKLSMPFNDAITITTSEIEDICIKKKKKRKKTKPKSQMIGMQFYSTSGQNRLLVASRDGSLVSLDIAQETWTVLKKWSCNVTTFATSETIDVDPSLGACMAIHPSYDKVVVGTADGFLVASDISSNTNLGFNVTPHRPIQSLKWLNNEKLLVFYVRGTIICYEFQGKLPKTVYLMKLSTTGIPLSCAYDCKRQDLYIGDSRGNIACFCLQPSFSAPCLLSNSNLAESDPSIVLFRVHAKEHVTDITISTTNETIFSVGNDGCIVQCKHDENGKMQKIFSIPVANVTGLRNIWLSEDSAVVGGYYGNDFVIFDITSGYEFVRVSTGGRQRRQELLITSDDTKFNAFLPPSYAMAICTGENSIEMHSQMVCQKTNFRFRPIFGHTLHAEPINRLAWVYCSEKDHCKYLLSGSNDCTVKLSIFEDNQIVSVKELPPHESCVRGVCASSHPDSESSLLVSCGGKLSIEFYLLHHKSDGDVSFLCSYRTLGSVSIDHRMNAVKALPLINSHPVTHLVVAADSDGDMHVVVVAEAPPPRQTTIGNIIRGNGRPVLCLDLVSCLNGRILAFAGNTAGEVIVWDVDKDADTASSPLLLSIDAHSSGINDLSVVTIHQSDSEDQLVLCSVGDDQTLSAYMVSLRHRNEDIDVTSSQIGQRQCWTSPLKAVKVTYDRTLHCCLVYTAGQDGFSSLWQLNFQCQTIKFITSSSTGTECNCIDSNLSNGSGGEEHELIAIGGEGIELQSINFSAIKAAKRLLEANYILITAGAGFSADSGLSTYECAPAEYKELCDPSQLMVDPDKFQQFWLNFTRSYRLTKHHVGYEIIDRWCSGDLPNLHINNGSMSPCWVYTSNVDGHFKRFKSLVGRVCEIHGTADEYICSCRIGFSEGKPRIGKDWNKWNEKIFDTCEQPKVQVSDDSTGLLTCDNCQLPLRPNVLMFNDTDEKVLNDIAIHRDRYQTWESQVEDSISQNGSKLVILEIGCGINVPAVRQESEEVLTDCTKIIESKGDVQKGSACLIRINPKNSEVDVANASCGSISIQENAKTALEEIDFWLRQLK